MSVLAIPLLWIIENPKLLIFQQIEMITVLALTEISLLFPEISLNQNIDSNACLVPGYEY